MSLRVERSETKQPQGLGLLCQGRTRYANAQRIMTVNIFVHLLVWQYYVFIYRT